MIWERYERAWPLLCILACLSVLALTWPRAWDQVAPFRLTTERGSFPDKGRVPLGCRAAAPDSARPWTPSLEQALERVSELQAAEPAPKLAGRPITSDWPELQFPEPLRRIHQPVVPEQQGKQAAKQESSEQSPVTRLPPIDASGSKGGGSATDTLPTLDRLVSRSFRRTSQDTSEGRWPEPVALLDRLEPLAWECETGPWAREVCRHVRRVASAGSQGSQQEAVSIVSRLEELDREADSVADQIADNVLATQLRQARHALTRWQAVWSGVIRAGGPSSAVGDPGDHGPQRLLACLTKVDATLVDRDADAVRAWREYLELDRLERHFNGPNAGDRRQCRTLARDLIERLTRPGMTAEQREFLDREPWVELEAELRRWAAEPIQLADLLRHLDQYEQTGAPGDARRVAEDLLLLGLSEDSDQRELGHTLQAHYRSGNFRLVLAQELLNRMTPDPQPEYQWVNDRVLGRPVHGRSVTSADVRIRMTADPKRLRMALEIEGLVSSLTESTAGPATFLNDTQSTYLARKEIELGIWGLRFEPAEVTVDNDIRLRALRTNLDVIPLVGAVAHEFAHSRHEKSQPEVDRDVQRKVTARAKQQIDEEADVQLGELHEQFKARVLDPLCFLSLKPTMLTAQTTERRLCMELRLAAEEQLAGHTLRPWAPGDSLASCQIHESALANGIEKMQLDGGTFTLADLRRRTATILSRPEMIEQDPGRDDVEITFAEKDAVSVRCRDGRLSVTLSIARLSTSSNRWTDFQVHADYRPEIHGPSAELVRDGVIGLVAGQSLGSQIPLRGIFSRIFSKQQPWQLTPERLKTDPRMADLEVTQLVIDDGWIGIAIGLKRADPEPVLAQRERGSVD